MTPSPYDVSKLDATNDITYSERGFARFKPIRCTYGSTIKVYESSSAQGPHLWLDVDCRGGAITKNEPGNGTAHLSLDQASELYFLLGRAIGFMSNSKRPWLEDGDE